MTKYRVTRPITKYGVYYADGEIHDDSSSVVASLARTYGWVKVEPVKAKPKAAAPRKRAGSQPKAKAKQKK